MEKISKSEARYLKSVDRFLAEMTTNDLGRITLAEKSLAVASRKAVRA